MGMYLYIISLVIVVIIVSEYSPQFAGLIGKRDSVATLVLLSLYQTQALSDYHSFIDRLLSLTILMAHERLYGFLMEM